MTKWERMAEKAEYFKDKNINDLSTEEINEYLELRKECAKLFESLSTIFEPFFKAIVEVFDNMKKL